MQWLYAFTYESKTHFHDSTHIHWWAALVNAVKAFFFFNLFYIIIIVIGYNFMISTNVNVWWWCAIFVCLFMCGLFTCRVRWSIWAVQSLGRLLSVCWMQREESSRLQIKKKASLMTATLLMDFLLAWS